MLCEEFFQSPLVSADQQRGRAFGEFSGKHFFIAVPQALGLVYNQCAPSFSGLENIGRVDKFCIKGRILAHQHGIKLFQGNRAGLFQFVPFKRVFHHF